MCAPSRATWLVVLLLLVACGRAEPTFGEKKTSEWAEALAGPDGGAPLIDRGSAAVPMLVEIATRRYGEEPAKRARSILLEMDASVIPALVPLLETGDARSRRACLRVLGDLGLRNEAAEAALRNLLSDPDLSMSCLAASTLYGLTGETETVLPVFVAGLERGEPFASEWISTIGAGAAPYAARLAPLLEAEDPLIRVGAVRALRGIGPGALPARRALRRYVEGTVPDAVEHGHDETSLEEKEKAIATFARRAGMRAAAAALVAIDPADQSGEGLLLWFLEHGNSTEVADAADALWQAGRRRAEAEAALRGLLARRSNTHAAASVLAQIGPEAAWAVPRLVELLDDREWRGGHQIGWGSHMDCARALGRMGPAAAAALPRLEAAMTRHHLRVRPIAALAVYRIGGDTDAVIRALVAVTSAEPGPGDSVCPGYEGDPGDWAAWDAVRALGEIAETNAAARAILERLEADPRPAVRRAARAALRKLR
jgi:HEAT repeat protein